MIKTNQGLIGGSVTLSEGTAVNSQITATLSEDALISKGTWKWEKSTSLASKKWIEITDKSSIDPDSKTSTYQPTEQDAGYYLRATFTVADNLNYTGSVSGITSNVVTESLASVTIYNKSDVEIAIDDAVVGNLLRAKVQPEQAEADVTYYWYHDGDTTNTIQSTGKEYVLSGKDVGKKLYVKAVAKSDGSASGEVESSRTEEIQKAKTSAPTVKPVLVTGETTDISVTVKMPDTIFEGLYQFGYKEANTVEDTKEFETYARANNKLTITGLKPNTTYYIFVKQIGENGYESSSWGNQQLSVTTENEHIKGTVQIKNDPIYGVTLQSSIENGNSDQTYDMEWYYINDDNSVVGPIGSGVNREINQSTWIGKRLRVVYKGKGLFSGEISADTDVVKKAEIHAPYNGLSTDTSVPASDTELELDFPKQDQAGSGLSKSEKFIVGYSLTAGGVPIEYRENGKVVEFTPESTNVKLHNFKRNTTYYLFLRYAESTTHYKSDWSAVDTCINITTRKTEFKGNISFTYATADKPIQGEKLKAVLNDSNTLDGEWKWTKISSDGSSETPITNFFPEEENSTYIMIPNDDVAIGTSYKVTFTPIVDFDGSATFTSNKVEKFNKEQHITPTTIPVITNKTDTTLTFKMNSGISGAIYEFMYSDTNDISTAKDVGTMAYDGTDVTITGLNRNIDYYIWVRRAKDEVKDASEYNNSCLTARTEKTDLHGYVTIESTPVVNETLKAEYVSASYIPSEEDTNGNWQWYRNSNTGYVVIPGASSDTYTPVTADIGKELKAVYSGTGNFQSEKSAVSAKTRKPVVTDPTVSISQIADQNDLLTVQATLDSSSVWYRLQVSSEDSPTLPTAYSDTDMTNAKWTKATGTTLTLNKDYTNTSLVPKTSYTIYIVKAETDTTQASNIISSSVEVGELTQRGTITFSGNVVVGEELTAKLNDNNNTNGTWKWYVSNEDYINGTTTSPDIKEESKWTQISTGYYPSVDSESSTLTIPDSMFAHYIKAEFVANESKFYKGTIKSNATSYVRKIYEETLTLSSSTKDGNNEPKAYSGTVITGTINNYIESDTLDKTRTTITFNIDTSTKTIIKPAEFKVNNTDNTATFTYTLGENKEFDGKTISATVSKPKNYNLYVDKNFNPITNSNLDSKQTSSNIGYKYGIPINNATDLENFMKQSGSYKNRSSGTVYLLTNNINMSSKGLISYSKNSFEGIFDGDFHTITGLKNPLISYIGLNSTSKNNLPTVKNLIINEAQIDTRSFSGKEGAGAVISSLAMYARFEKILVTNANVIGGFDGGLLTGGLGFNAADDPGFGEFYECGSAGGSIITQGARSSVGGLIGHFRQGDASDNFAVSSTVNSGGIGSGVAVGGLVGSSWSFVANISNSFSNSTLGNGDRRGGVSTGGGSGIGKNLFYDKTILTESLAQSDPTGWGKSTADLIGFNLKNLYGSEKWNYNEGYYPRLKWVSSHPLATLYSATRGAFISINNSTSSNDMLNGIINGPIKVPLELQKSTYSYQSSNESVLKVTAGGTIIPVGNVNQSADITITYTEPDESIGGTANNKYTFKIGKKMTALANLAITGGSHPGEMLTAVVSSSSPVTYQWYRRPQGTFENVAIPGAKNNTYIIQPSDIGMEINVEVTANGFPTASNYTKPITSVAPTGITIKETTDTNIKVIANGVTGANYEYAYAASADGKKTIAGQSKSEFTINGLTRDTDYWLFARVAGADDGSYEASPWSAAVKVTTKKTDILGEIKINANINMGQVLTASMSDTNLQTGTWKLERVEASGNKVVLTPSTADTYSLSYNLTKADAGSKIRISFEATGHFKNPDSGVVYVETKDLLLQAQEPPASPTSIAKDDTDHQLQIKETDPNHATGTLYEFGYRKNTKDPVTLISGTYDKDVPATITGLDRNTTYYVYARKAKKEDYEPSPWSPGIQITTKKTNIEKSKISKNGTEKVDETITFSVDNDDSNVKGQTGIWVLERVGEGMTNTLLGNTSDDTHTLSYQIVPEDSGYKLKATYIANGDYENSVTFTTENTVINNTQSIGDIKPNVEDSDVKTYTIGASVKENSNDIYEFGYRKAGENSEITPYSVTVTWNNIVDIGPLERDTTYDIFVRKAKKTGYDASGWSTAVQKKTLKETLNGNITYTGSTAVGDTMTAEYEPGIYDYVGDDTGGTWQWYLNDQPVDGAIQNTFKIKPMSGNPKVSVKYTAAEDSGFEGTIEREFGDVYKPPYAVPTAAKVTAENEDHTAEGSILNVTNTDIDHVYIYLRLADNDILPDLVVASTVTEGLKDEAQGNIERWIKAEAEMKIRVPANRSYIVYSARLEDDTNVASEISSARGVLSAKEPLLRDPVTDGKITDQDTTIPWKALQEKTLTYSLYGKAPTATWKYYVHGPNDAEGVWQNIDSELNALGRIDEIKDGVSYSTISIPLKYKDYQVKATLTGNDDYSGSVEYITPKVEGKLINETAAQIIKSDKTQLLDKLTATYTATDDVNGYFVWYRRNGEGTVTEIKKDSTNTTSSYQLQQQDLNCYVYAVYHAAANGQYSGTSTTDSVFVKEKASQNQPVPVETLQVNGNSVQVKAPDNYNRDGMDMIPQVVMGYQECDSNGNVTGNVTWQIGDAIGNNWFKKLKKNTYYVFYAQFLGTEVYGSSAISEKSTPVLTENETFDEDNLAISLVKTDTGNPDEQDQAIIGDVMRVSFTGEGFDEGEFSLKRSNGEDIPADKITNLTIDAKNSTITFDYVYTPEDVGSTIIVSYSAKADAEHFDGSISSSSKKIVMKPETKASAVVPTLERGLDTDLIVELQDGYEYWLTDNANAVPEESDWDILEANMTTNQGEAEKYDFKNLGRTTTYYLHARIAETAEHQASQSVRSEGVSPEPYIDMGNITVTNTKSTDKAAMSATAQIDYPYTLDKNNLTITEMTLTRENNESQTAVPDNSIDTFADSNGKATRAVLEKGSTWADTNFAFNIKLYGEDGSVVSATNGDKTTLDAKNAVKMNLEIYRANAVANGGTYIWKALIKDESGHEALLQSKVTFQTDIKEVVPMKIEMNLFADTYLKQTSNTQQIRNEGLMPVTVGVDKKATAAAGIPDLSGVYKGQEVSSGAAYLKISNDNSNYTSRWNGVWLDTNLQESKIYTLAGLGHNAAINYYTTGIVDPGHSWPWPENGSKVIENAYQIKFVTGISQEDISLETQNKKVFKEE